MREVAHDDRGQHRCPEKAKNNVVKFGLTIITDAIADCSKRFEKIATQIPVKFDKKKRLATIPEGIFRVYRASMRF